MELDSVRDLKRELYEPLQPRSGLLPQDAPAVSVPAERATELAVAQPGIALGVAPVGAGDFRLAVRVQHRDLLGSSRLEAIDRAARGEINVRYVGRLAKQDAVREARRRRPVALGTSVGHHAITAGTVGAFVRVDGDGRPRLLSNNHVLADENRGEPGDVVLQPGALDGGQQQRDRIGALERFVALDGAAVNEIDAALALLDEGVDIEPAIPGIGPVTGLASADEIERVVKVGRTTGLTRGGVTAIEVDNVVVQFSTGAFRFDGQLEISGSGAAPFSQGGDSGSLILAEGDQRAVGLLFAGSDQGGLGGYGFTYANPIGAVFDRLDISALW